MKQRRSATAAWCCLLAATTVASGLATTSASAQSKAIGKIQTQPRPATSRLVQSVERVERDATITPGPGATLQASGWISVASESLSTGERTTLLLNSRDGRTFRLNVPESADVTAPGGAAGVEDLRQGAVVTVNGTLSAGTLSVASAHVTSTLRVLDLGPIANAADRPNQARSVLTILANFSDDPTPQPVSQQYIYGEMFSTAATDRSVANFYSQASRQTLTLSGTVTPWVPLNMLRGSTCDYKTWMNTAKDRVLETLAIEADNYDKVVLVVPDATTDGCELLGVNWNTRDSLVWADSEPQPKPFRTGTAAHELGHSFGLGHSGRMRCAFAFSAVTLSDDCDSERWDFSDAMGNSAEYRLFQGHSRIALGFLPRSNVQDIPVDGQAYSLARTSSTLGTGKQVLRVRRSVAAPDPTEPDAFYYLDYRAPSAPFDDFPATHSAIRGVSIHLAPDIKPIPYALDQPTLVNPANGFQRAGNAKANFLPVNGQDPDVGAALLPGQRFYDPVENITVAVGGVSATAADVRVVSGMPTDGTTTVGLSGGVLSVTAAAGKQNAISLSRWKHEINIVDSSNAVSLPAACRRINPVTIACPISQIVSVNVNLGDGDDSATIGSIGGTSFGLPVELDPGAGDDQVDAVSGRRVRIIAGPAADGRDVYALATHSTIQTTLDYSARTTPLTVKSAADSPTITVVGEGDTVFGGAESVVTGSGADTLELLSPRTTRIDGGGGADRVTLGAGAASVFSRDGGADIAIDCGGGGDTLSRDTADAGVTNCATSSDSPQAVITSGLAPDTVVNNPVGTFTFSAPGSTGVTFQCQTIGPAGTGAWASCTSPASPAIGADGSYAFSVQAVEAGNPVGLPASRTFRRDSTPPETTLTTTIDGAGQRLWAFTNSEVATGTALECSMDGLPYTLCPSSPYTQPTLPDGLHTFAVRAVDTVGTVDPSPATDQFASGNQAAIQSSGVVPDATNVSLSSSNGSPAIDWIHWNHAYPATAFERMNTPQLISTWSQYGDGNGSPSRTALTSNSPTYSWTNALVAPAIGSSRYGVGISGLGRGFRFTVPVTPGPSLRKLRLWLRVRGVGTIGTLKVRLNDGTGSSLDIAGQSDTSSAPTTSATVNVRSFASATDTLTVEWYQSGGAVTSASQVALFAAALS